FIGFDDQIVVDADFAELIDDHRVALAVVFGENAVEEGSLAGTEIAGEHGDRNLGLCLRHGRTSWAMLDCFAVHIGRRVQDCTDFPLAQRNVERSNRATSCRSSTKPLAAWSSRASPICAEAPAAFPVTPSWDRSLIFQPKAWGP